MRLTSKIFLVCYTEALLRCITIPEFLEIYNAYLSDDDGVNWPPPQSTELASYIIFKDPKLETMFLLEYGDKL